MKNANAIATLHRHTDRSEIHDVVHANSYHRYVVNQINTQPSTNKCNTLLHSIIHSTT